MNRRNLLTTLLALPAMLIPKRWRNDKPEWKVQSLPAKYETLGPNRGGDGWETDENLYVVVGGSSLPGNETYKFAPTDTNVESVMELAYSNKPMRPRPGRSVFYKVPHRPAPPNVYPRLQKFGVDCETRVGTIDELV